MHQCDEHPNLAHDAESADDGRQLIPHIDLVDSSFCAVAAGEPALHGQLSGDYCHLVPSSLWRGAVGEGRAVGVSRVGGGDRRRRVAVERGVCASNSIVVRPGQVCCVTLDTL